MGVLASLLVHAAALGAISTLTVLPPIEFELQLPSEVRFGIADGAEEPATPSTVAAPTPEEATEEVSEKTVEQVGAQQADAESDPGSDREPKPKRARKPAPDGGTVQAATAGLQEADAGAALLSAYAPEGAQVALRIDLERIRGSILSEDVRSLLAVIPDWQAILGGSGIEPLADLNRLYLASPDLRRENLVVAGQYAGGEEIARKAVANLAAEQGKKADWSRKGGLEFAPWLNRDETERIVVLLGSETFVITREMDLPRVIAVARALAERAEREGEQAPAEADALLAMPEGVSISLSIEGARLFARGDLRGIPSRLQVTVGESEEGQIRVEAVGVFDSPEQAEAARDWWEKRRQRYMGHPVILLMGLSVPLSNTVVESREERVEVKTVLTIQQMRMVLGFLRSALAPPESTQPEPPASPGAPSPRQEIDTPAASPEGSPGKKLSTGGEMTPHRAAPRRNAQ